MLEGRQRRGRLGWRCNVKERVAEMVRWLRDKRVDHDRIGGRPVVIMSTLQADDLLEVLMKLQEKINDAG